jgi:excisionase family DNA binding protein
MAYAVLRRNTGGIVEKLLTTEEVAELTGFKRRTIEEWRRSGKGPRYVVIEHRIRYRPADVEAWIDSMTVGVTEGSE